MVDNSYVACKDNFQVATFKFGLKAKFKIIGTYTF